MIPSHRLLVTLAVTIALAAPAAAAPTPAQRCAVAKSKAAGKKVGAKLKCVQKAILAGDAAPDPGCVAAADAKFDAAVATAEGKGGCLTNGDANSIDAAVDNCVGDISELTPGEPATTTTTIAPTTTTLPGPFGCEGAPLPTTAPATITISGTIIDDDLGVPISGANLIVRSRITDAIVTVTTSNAAGAFSFNVSTGGIPADIYMNVIRSPAYIQSDFAPASPFAGDATVTVPMLSPSRLSALSAVGAGNQTSGKGYIRLVVEDCDGNPVAGATAMSVPAATPVRYNSGGSPNSSTTSTDTDGIAHLFNATPGSVAVDASKSSIAFREHDVPVEGDIVTVTVVAP
jgi:hypothetical protein